MAGAGAALASSARTSRRAPGGEGVKKGVKGECQVRAIRLGPLGRRGKGEEGAPRARLQRQEAAQKTRPSRNGSALRPHLARVASTPPPHWPQATPDRAKGAASGRAPGRAGRLGRDETGVLTAWGEPKRSPRAGTPAGARLRRQRTTNSASGKHGGRREGAGWGRGAGFFGDGVWKEIERGETKREARARRSSSPPATLLPPRGSAC